MSPGWRRFGIVAAAAGILLAGVGTPAAVAAPGPPDAPEYWFDTWHAQSLWNSGADGHGITIAEIDTGVNASLSAFRGRLLKGTDLGKGGIGHVDRDKDTFGHGTAMASIMVGRASSFDVTGLAPGAKLLPIAIPLIGTTDEENNDHLDDAIRYAADHGAKIISMSLGGTRTQKRDGVACYPSEQAAVFHALSKGALVIASSGNRGAKDSAVEEPGVCLGVVSVGAVDRSGAVASFSSHHPYLTLTAPGVNIPTLGRIAGQAFAGEGTSQAAALASAAAALVWSKYPKLSAEQLLTRLLATTDHHENVQNPAYGYGIINPYRAVHSAQPKAKTNPVYAAARPFMAQAAGLIGGAAKVPSAAVRKTNPEGTFRVGSPPGRFSSGVVEGMAVSVAGLLALLFLVVGGVRRNRMRAAHSAAVAEALLHTPPAPYVDAEGVEWHQILTDETPPAP